MAETIAVSPLRKCELRTRHGRRVRCNGLIWKHLCADTKDTLDERKCQRQSLPLKSTNQICETEQNDSAQTTSSSSDIIDSSIQSGSITQIRNNKRRKAADNVNDEEHIVSKRKTIRQPRTGKQ